MIGINWNWKLILLITSASQDLCFGVKLERKQDFFDSENFDSKREYGLNEIGKRGFTSTLGYDYSTSTEYGIGGSNGVSPDYSSSSSVRPGRNGGTLSPARDLVPPPVSGVYSSSTSPPTTRSDYTKFDEISSSSSQASTKEFYSPFRSQLSRRSPPYFQRIQSSNYFDDIASAAATNRGGGLNPGTYGLVADGEGKLIGYRGSILPGYSESQSAVSSNSRGIPEQANFIGGYFPGSAPVSDYTKPKLSAASSATNGIYTSTPVYYPGREEDHTYRMRDTSSQGYGDDDEMNPSSEDTDFRIGNNAYQASPISPTSHYQGRENDGSLSHLEKDHYVPFRREQSVSGFSYGRAPVDHRRPYAYKKRSYNAPNPPTYYSIHGVNSLERPVTESYSSLGFNDYGSL
ncbi:unnamed protein product [Orchesella dallaii]|uniref:Uncharacterized protein n=1 Tax=Orchesella dallaii TaxID=48710 RepID=A0ABP1QA53_9HEXA